MTTRFASLGMYDGGELTAANDALWSSIAERLVGFGLADVPRALERERPLEELWSSGVLLFGQTCGYPFAARYRGRLRLVAAPQYSVPGCTAEGHSSFVIVPATSPATSLDALRGARAVINEAESLTGRHLLGDAAFASGGAGGFFGSVTLSGSHARSLASIAAGTADVAAIDCVSYAHLERAVPEQVAATRIIHRTEQTPSLPFVISSALGEVAAVLVWRALSEAMTDPKTEEARRLLHLAGIDRSSPSAYDRTLAIAARANQAFEAATHGAL